MMRALDQATSKFAFGERNSGFSCIPEVSPPPYCPRRYADAPDQNREEVSGDGVTLRDVYSGFLARCCAVARSALQRNELDRNNILDAEPFVILGIPAVALFDILVEDEQNLGNGVAIHCADMEITRESLVNNGIVTVFWPKVMKLRRQMRGLNLSGRDIEFVRFALIAGSSPEDAMTEASRGIQDSFNKDLGLNKAKLNGLVGDLTSFAIDASRLGFMASRFQGEVLIRSTAKVSVEGV
jgi:hypothetical protein